VFSANATSAATGTAITTSFPVDLQVWSARASSLALNRSFIDRLRGAGTLTTDSNSPYLLSPSTAAEATDYGNTRAWSNTGFSIADVFGGINSIYWNFGRAPSFFDEVCYTGNGAANRAVTHGLGVAPQFMIVKLRSGSGNWWVYSNSLAVPSYLLLDTNGAVNSLGSPETVFPSAATATNFYVDGATYTNTNGSGATYVAYLFASCPGVSKVGSYTGTGATQVINCGFTGGARFVLIKSTSTTGDWYVWDSARGIVAGNDPYLELNTVNAEVTGTDWVDTAASGFELSNSGGNLANSNGVSYIFLAIA